nr:glycerol kinase [Nitrosomonas sp.]
EIPVVQESTAWGAAALAGLQSNIFMDLTDISSNWSCRRRYQPAMEPSKRHALYAGWKNAVKRVLK